MGEGVGENEHHLVAGPETPRFPGLPDLSVLDVEAAGFSSASSSLGVRKRPARRAQRRPAQRRPAQRRPAQRRPLLLASPAALPQRHPDPREEPGAGLPHPAEDEESLGRAAGSEPLRVLEWVQRVTEPPASVCV